MPRTVSLALCLMWLSPLAADDWPHFRGPGLTNTSHEVNWAPTALEPEPRIAWKSDIGIGYSGPAIVGDAVYVMGFADDQEHVRRLDARTGAEVWIRSYGGAKIDTLNAGGPGATPTVAGDVLYTNGREGQLHCLKTSDGSVVWSIKLPDAYGTKVPEWGFTTSPLLIERKIIVDAGVLVAFDAETGEEIWKSDVAHKPGYGTPTPFEFDGEMYLAHLNNDGVSVVKLSDGTEVAFYAMEAQFDTAGASPIVKGDTLWVSVGYDGYCALLKFTGASLEEIYRNKRLKNQFSNSILIGEYLYGLTGNTNHGRNCALVCMKHDTGEVAWRQREVGFGSLVAADGHLIFLNDTGAAAVIPANPAKFEYVSKGNVLDGECWTAPVLANGRLYCRNSEGTLVAVDLARPSARE